MRSRRFRAGTFLFLASWVTCLAIGFTLALGHAAEPGASARAPAVMSRAQASQAWPKDRFRLLVFVHPQCPCTRATIEELDRIAARAGSQACIRAYFLSDPDREEAWTKSATWRAASAIPGVEVAADRQGRTARAFGAATSGTVLLYAAEGELLFRGGITSSRGHAGDNPGADAIVAALRGEPAVRTETPVYGCALFDRGGAPPSDP